MYVILVYDINSEDNQGKRVWNKAFKTCKRYLIHIQNSVFEGEMLDSQLLKLKKELENFIRKDRDSLIIFTSRDQRWLEKEFIGKNEEDKTSNFL